MSVVILAIIIHVIVWHANGTYTRMYEMASEGKAYLSVLYNLGLVSVTSAILAFLIEKIMNLIADTRQTKNSSNESEKETSDK